MSEGNSCYPVSGAGNEDNLGPTTRSSDSPPSQSLPRIKSHLWMSGKRLTKYQAILLEFPEVTIKICNVLNLAPLLPSELMTEHTCEQA
jgi:hypothetical protein